VAEGVGPKGCRPEVVVAEAEQTEGSQAEPKTRPDPECPEDAAEWVDRIPSSRRVARPTDVKPAEMRRHEFSPYEPLRSGECHPSSEGGSPR